MIGSWEIDSLTESERLFAYSRSYLRSSIVLCTRVQRLRRKPQYPDASVVLHLARHAVELFLKGAIMAREPGADLHHDLDKLQSTYDRLYPELALSWSQPFKTEYLGRTPNQLAEARRSAPRVDQIYRYPISKSGVPWDGIYALDPRTFHRQMQTMEKTLRELIRKICEANRIPPTYGA